MVAMHAMALTTIVVLSAFLSSDVRVAASGGWHEEAVIRTRRQVLGTSVTTLTTSTDNTCQNKTYKDGGVQVAECPPGYYGVEVFQQCQPCQPQCATCDSPQSCTSCKAGRVFQLTATGNPPSNLGLGECLTECKTGYSLVRRSLSNTNRMRLVPGPSATGDETAMAGRLEVRDDNGNWGTVCNRSFTLESANVVCRQLGFVRASKLTNGVYPIAKRDLPVNLGFVKCIGSEQNIQACPLQRRDTVTCSHYEDVEIQCHGPDLQSTCEVKCPTGFFRSDASGSAVCRPCDPTCLGCLSSPTRCTSCPYGRFLNGSTCVATCGDGYFGNSLTWPPRCEVCAPSCAACMDGPKNDKCTLCPADMYLFNNACQATCPFKTIRATTRLLSPAGNNLVGIVQVFYNGKWGPVCRDSFTRTAGTVVCRSLGLGSATRTPITRGSYRGTLPGSGVPTLLDNVKCSGNETDIRSCEHAPFGVHDCNNNENVVVYCSGPYVSPSNLIKCVKDCPLGTYYHQADNLCLACGSSCLGCRDLALSCTACKRRTYLIGTQCVAQCPSHMYADITSNTCKTCSSVCRTCSSGVQNATCTSCNGGRLLSGSSCVMSCPPPLLAYKGNCVPTCPTGYLANADLRSCDECPANCTKCSRDANKNVRCSECKKPLLESNGQCTTSCPAGYGKEALVTSTRPRVRLAGGNSSSGRVEIFYANRWGTVCDDYWGMTNAMVVCRELGFSTVLEDRYPVTNKFSDAHNDDPIWMDNVRCSATDQSLFNCSHLGWGRTDCSHSEDVAISCGGSLAERCTQSCSDGLFGQPLSSQGCQRCAGSCLTCRGKESLCSSCHESSFLYNFTCVTQCPPGYFKNALSRACTPCHNDCKTCAGTARNCTSCAKQKYLVNNQCQATCSPLYAINTGESDVRLRNGRTPLEGRVEIFHQGKWGFVCDDYWSLADGEVVCQQLNFGHVIAVFFRSYFGSNSSQDLVLDDVKCVGNETRLQECPARAIGTHNCFNTEVAGVQCSGPDSSQRCVSSCPSGYIARSGECTRCALTCGSCPVSQTTCGSCYPGFYLQDGACLPACSSNYFNQSFTCQRCHSSCAKCDGPSANNCTDCASDKFLLGSTCVSSCNKPRYLLHTRPAGGIRLSGSSVPRAGRVEVFNTGTRQWGTVCDDQWTWNDAIVVCKQLGLGPPVSTITQHNRTSNGITYYATITNRTYPIHLDDLRCRGTEPTLYDCNHAGVLVHNCQHSEDAGVVCAPPLVTAKVCLPSCASELGYRVENEAAGTCEKCAATCSQCSASSASLCEKCIPGRFLSSSSAGQCNLQCESNEYGNTNMGKCMPCDEDCDGCFYGETNDRCMRCKPESGKVLTNTTCQSACPNNDGVERRPLRETFEGNLSNVQVANDIVQLNISGKYVPICSSGRAWDRYAATVVCRQLNMGLPISWTTQRVPGYNQEAVSFLYCLGTESNIFQCRMSTTVVSTCYRALLVCNSSLEAYDDEVCTAVNKEECRQGLCEAAAGCFSTSKVPGYKSACWECPRTFVGDGQTCATYSLTPHRLVLNPRNRSAIVNQTVAVVMACGANASTIINWYHRNSTGSQRLNLLPEALTTVDYIRPSFRYKLSATGSLLLGNVQLFMAGMYVCTARTTISAELTSAYLSVIQPIPVKILPFNATIMIQEKTQFVLRCRTSGYPVPNIEWRRDGVAIVPDGVKFGLTNDSLIFFSPTFGDVGTYSCYARNNYTSASASTVIRVRGVPIFSNTPPLVVGPILENGNIILTCGLTNFSDTDIFWLYPRSVKPTTRVVITETLDGPTSTLTIRNAVHSDSGLYTCTAVNSVGLADHQVSVVVPAMKVNASNTATMECADYFTTSSLRTSWTVIKNEERLQVPVSGRFIQNGSHLTIQEVEVQDSGRYECLIVDVQEKTLSQRETTLEVIGKPVLSTTSRNYTLTEGDLSKSVTFNLSIDSNIEVTVTWTLNGKPIISDAHRTVLSDHSLQICGIQSSDLGAYAAIVSNAAGTSTIDDNTIRDTQPTQPPPASSNTTVIIVVVVCLLVVLVIVVVGGVLIYRRRRDLNIFQVKGDRKTVGKGASTRSTAAFISEAPDSMAVGNRLASEAGDTDHAQVGKSLPTKAPEPAPQMHLSEDAARFTVNGVQATLHSQV